MFNFIYITMNLGMQFIYKMVLQQVPIALIAMKAVSLILLTLQMRPQA